MNKYSKFATTVLCSVLLTAGLLSPARAQEDILGSSEALLSNANAFCSESALGDTVADALRTQSGAELAVVSSGDLSLYLMSGALTYDDVAASVPENSPYGLVAMTPAELKALLEEGVDSLVLTEQETIDFEASQCDDFPQISGFSFRCDSSAPPGDRIMSISLEDGTRLDLEDQDTTYLVAAPLDALTPEQARNATDCGGLQDMFLDYLADHSPLEKQSLSRIQILGAHAKPLISSGPVIMVGLIILVCSVMAIPSILRRQKNPEARESMYFTGFSSLRNKK